MKREDEIELEIFRADDRASRGIKSTDLAELADAFDAEANPVAGVIGHPKSDTPAHALVKAVRAEGNKLFATVTNFSDKLIAKLKSGEIINRSAAFFGADHEANPTPGKLALRHLGFLGASAPGIPGMQPLKKAFSFTADEDEELVVDSAPASAVVFDAPATPIHHVKEDSKPMATETKDDAALEADRKQLADDRAEFDARVESARKSASKSRVTTLVTAGKVLPANSAALEQVFNALDDEEIEFAADDKAAPADKLFAILSAGPPLVDIKGEPLSFDARGKSGDAPTTREGVDAAARALMKEKPSLTFAAAVAEVSGQNGE